MLESMRLLAVKSTNTHQSNHLCAEIHPLDIGQLLAKGLSSSVYSNRAACHSPVALQVQILGQLLVHVEREVGQGTDRSIVIPALGEEASSLRQRRGRGATSLAIGEFEDAKDIHGQV